MNAAEALINVLGDPVLQAFTFTTGSLAIARIVHRDRARHAPQRTARRARRVPGLPGLRWGQAPAEDMTLYHDGLVEKLYARATPLVLAGVPLRSVVYSFHLGRLQALMVDVPRRASDDVLRALVDVWGPPTIAGTPARKRFWKDLGTGADAMTAVYDPAPGARCASLVITSKRIHEERAWVEPALQRLAEPKLEATR